MRNRILLLILPLIFLLPVLVVAQSIPKKIHDLKSLTDSSGTVHLFYRIEAEYGSQEGSNNIYHYNTKMEEDVLFLEDNYNTHEWFNKSNHILEYKFLDNNPDNYVYINVYDTFGFISRSDSTGIMGGFLTFMDNLNVEGTDSGRVYVEMGGEVIIGLNGGREFPEVDAERFDEIPDSLKLGFPLISLSPYDKSLMFGRKLHYSGGENALLRSIDKGKSSEIISDTLLPSNIYFDSDSNTVYIIHKLSTPVPEINCNVNTCNYGLYANKHRGEAGLWELKKIFPSSVGTPLFPEIVTDPYQPGKLFIWNADSVLVSEDYGDNFSVHLNSTEDITGFTVTQSKEYYTTTTALFSYKNGASVELFSIPVSNEYKAEIPNQNRLLPNYPNPFNPTTTISYEMQKPGHVVMNLYTITGKFVKELLNQYNTSGSYHFQLNAEGMASGTYILRGELSGQTATRTITLIK
ncbi:MAG: T9SS type A sorting domain-containing protein [Balneolaceae bacterium]